MNPSIPIFITGPTAQTLGGLPCATCCILYGGTISADPLFQKYVKEGHEKAEAEGQAFYVASYPNEMDNLQIQPYVTVAPSYLFPDLGSMPVCWTHMIGYRQPTQAEREAAAAANEQVKLIRGKAYGSGS